MSAMMPAEQLPKYNARELQEIMTEEFIAAYPENSLIGAGKIVVSPFEPTNDVISYIGGPELSDVLLKQGNSEEKYVFKNPFGTVIILPRKMEMGNTYYIHYLIGPIFNPEDGLLKPLVMYNEHGWFYQKKPNINLQNIIAKLAIPEDKIYVDYDHIQIKGLWDEDMKSLYQTIDGEYNRAYEEYKLQAGKEALNTLEHEISYHLKSIMNKTV